MYILETDSWQSENYHDMVLNDVLSTVAPDKYLTRNEAVYEQSNTDYDCGLFDVYES